MRPCPACTAARLRVFYTARDIPTHSNLLMTSEAAARADRAGQLELAVCDACGFITNLVFDPETQKATSGYEATQGCSPTFTGYLRKLAELWVERYHLAGRPSLEIGCGQGELVTLLAEVSGGLCVGIDPVVDPARVAPPSRGQVRLLVEEFDLRHAALLGDFVCCRHTLEHIARPLAFVTLLRQAIGERPVAVAFEVPDTLRVLEEAAFWDLYFEHCSYFTPGSLAGLFRRCGLPPVDLRLEYGGQYLVLEARPSASATPRLPLEEDAPATVAAVDRFVETCRTKTERWRRDLRTDRTAGKTAVVWGAGSKAVGFLTTLGLAEEVAAVVDINPHKQGTYLPGSGHLIVGPSALRELRPDTVVVMNPVYVPEITRDLGAMGLAPRVVALT
jgi:hypothetical protein